MPRINFWFALTDCRDGGAVQAYLIAIVVFAQFGKNLGSLIEAVNRLGSLFNRSLLVVFTLAFFVPKVGGNGAFFGMLAAEAAIFAAYFFTGISFLWYNVIGCVMVVGTGLLFGGE
jgi:SSS family solute:Na+ symporter